MGEGFGMVWCVYALLNTYQERVWRGFEFIDIAFLRIKKVENGSWW